MTMPIHEYKCPMHHITEKLFLTFGESEVTDYIVCTECGQKAVKIMSLPGEAIFYGQGWYKPAPSGNHSYKRNDPSKAVKEQTRGKGIKGLQEPE